MAGLNGSFALPGNLSLRFAGVDDEPFLFQLLKEARPWLSWAEGSSDFLRVLHEQQFNAIRTGLGQAYPEHMDMIIEDCGIRVGRLVVSLGYNEWRLSELQLLTAAQGKGIGSGVIRSLQMAAARLAMPITLSTPMFGSNGIHLYHRLGFHVTETVPPHHHMRWLPLQVVANVQH
jgi:GNAT superfamily N-acetyltransferase